MADQHCRISDAELASRLRDSDGSALSELYRRFGWPGYSLARRICADDRLAEDVVAEVFSTLWRDPRRFDPRRGSFATWLLTLIHRTAVDAVRRESTIRARASGTEWSPTPVNGTDPAAPTRVRASQVRAALDELPDEQRQVLAGAYLDGHTQREIAGFIGVPLTTVKSRMFAGVQRLQSLITEQLGPDALVAEARAVAKGSR